MADRRRTSGQAIRQEGADLARIPVAVLDPGDGLTLLIGRRIGDCDSGGEVRSVNAPQISSPGEHLQNRLRLSIRLVVFEVKDHAQLR